MSTKGVSIKNILPLIVYIIYGAVIVASLFVANDVSHSYVRSESSSIIPNPFSIVSWGLTIAGQVFTTAFGWTSTVYPFLLIVPLIRFAIVSLKHNQTDSGERLSGFSLQTFISGIAAIIILSALSGLLFKTDFVYENNGAGGVIGLVASFLFSNIITKIIGVVVLLSLFYTTFCTYITENLEDALYVIQSPKEIPLAIVNFINPITSHISDKLKDKNKEEFIKERNEIVTKTAIEKDDVEQEETRKPRTPLRVVDPYEQYKNEHQKELEDLNEYELAKHDEQDEHYINTLEDEHREGAGYGSHYGRGGHNDNNNNNNNEQFSEDYKAPSEILYEKIARSTDTRIPLAERFNFDFQDVISAVDQENKLREEANQSGYSHSEEISDLQEAELKRNDNDIEFNEAHKRTLIDTGKYYDDTNYTIRRGEKRTIIEERLYTKSNSQQNNVHEFDPHQIRNTQSNSNANTINESEELNLDIKSVQNEEDYNLHNDSYQQNTIEQEELEHSDDEHQDNEHRYDEDEHHYEDEEHESDEHQTYTNVDLPDNLSTEERIRRQFGNFSFNVDDNGDVTLAKKNTSNNEQYGQSSQQNQSEYRQTSQQQGITPLASDPSAFVVTNRESHAIKTASAYTDYTVPIECLDAPIISHTILSDEEVQATSSNLVNRLEEFNVQGTVKGYIPGPVVTTYEFEPAPGIKLSKMISLSKDIALGLRLSESSIRIAPINERGVVGFEIPNKDREIVALREIIESDEFQSSKSPLSIAIGKTSYGDPLVVDLASMPHLLIAGTTGSGKSVAVNTIISSIIYKSSPDVVKFIMIDPKSVELSVYENIPHLAAPVITDTSLAPNVLKNVIAEMERRYQLLQEFQVRHIQSYNEIIDGGDYGDEYQRLPFIVVIIDEFADLMATAGKEIENSIIRLAQKARAIGIHLVLATQRPSVDVITGTIKSNMPCRMSFRVPSKTDSRVILDENGAEELLGKGDGLFLSPYNKGLERFHSAYIDEEQIKSVTTYLTKYGSPVFNSSFTQMELIQYDNLGDTSNEDFKRALRIASEIGEISISRLQREMKIGYNRSAKIVETMEALGIVDKSDGTSRPRKLLKNPLEFLQ